MDPPRKYMAEGPGGNRLSSNMGVSIARRGCFAALFATCTCVDAMAAGTRAGELKKAASCRSCN